MGFLTDEEMLSLNIKNMILHVVSDSDFQPETKREVEHEMFFIDRIRDTDVAAVFEFDPHSQTKLQLEKMATGEDDFEKGAQALSRQFSRFHNGGSKDGAFFIFEIETKDPKVRVYNLIKYDYQQVVEQASNEEKGGLLRLILQAFVAEKRAIQKSAIVRVVNGIAETSVAARDRMKPSPEIGDYFAKFLEVKRTRTNQELNQDAKSVVRNVLVESKEILPEKDVAKAFRRAQESLNERQEINETVIFEAILAAANHPDEEEICSKLQVCIRRKMRTSKLDGLSFPTDRQILRRPPTRRVKTTEGVIITYKDETDSGVVDRVKKEGGGEIITITTNYIIEDKLVSDNRDAI